MGLAMDLEFAYDRSGRRHIPLFKDDRESIVVGFQRCGKSSPADVFSRSVLASFRPSWVSRAGRGDAPRQRKKPFGRAKSSKISLRAGRTIPYNLTFGAPGM